MKAVLYCRTTTVTPEPQTCLQREHTAALQYCERHQLELIAIYRDEGISGTSPLHTRPAGRRLLEDATAGQFQRILIADIDRLASSLKGFAAAIEHVHASGARIISLDHEIQPGALPPIPLRVEKSAKREPVSSNGRGLQKKARQRGKAGRRKKPNPNQKARQVEGGRA